MNRDAFRKFFKSVGPAVLPVIHVLGKDQAERNVRYQGIGTAAELPGKLQGQLVIPLTDTGAGAEGLNFGTPAAPGGAQPSGELTPEQEARAKHALRKLEAWQQELEERLVAGGSA